MAFSGSMKSQRKAIEKGGCKTEKNHLQQPLHQKQSIPGEKKNKRKARTRGVDEKQKQRGVTLASHHLRLR
jgi:hypothetical protein